MVGVWSRDGATAKLAARVCTSPVPLSQVSTRMKHSVSAHALLSSSTLNPIHPDLGPWGTLRKILRLWAQMHVMLGFPRKWSVQTLRFVCFVMLLLPGFVPPFLSYLFSEKIRKNIRYGPSWRHQLDLYLPLTTTDANRARARVPRGGTAGQKMPVVVFISGGGWMIGYKMWGFLMGQLLQKQGVLFITPDYRNFPEASVSGMVEDVLRALDWVFANVATLGGDLENITLMGQSAGAHLAALAMLEHITKEQNATRRLGDDCRVEAQPEITKVSWSVRSLRRWVGISGPYDLVDALPKFRERGVPRRMLQSLMENDILHHSPARRVREMSLAGQRAALELLPAIHLFHGTADDTVDWRQSEGFSEILRRAGVRVETKYYEHKSHTGPIVEDPIAGAGDELMSDLLQLLIPGTRCDDTIGGWQPALLLRCAKVINPF